MKGGERTESVLKNIARSEKSLIASFELGSEILNLLRTEAEKSDDQAYLSTIAKYERENAELRSKIQDLEQRKEVAIDILKRLK